MGRFQKDDQDRNEHNWGLPAQSQSQVVNVQGHVQTWQPTRKSDVKQITQIATLHSTHPNFSFFYYIAEPRSENLSVYIWVKGRGQRTLMMSDCHRSRVVGFLYTVLRSSPAPGFANLMPMIFLFFRIRRCAVGTHILSYGYMASGLRSLRCMWQSSQPNRDIVTLGGDN